MASVVLPLHNALLLAADRNSATRTWTADSKRHTHQSCSFILDWRQVTVAWCSSHAEKEMRNLLTDNALLIRMTATCDGILISCIVLQGLQVLLYGQAVQRPKCRHWLVLALGSCSAARLPAGACRLQKRRALLQRSLRLEARASSLASESFEGLLCPDTFLQKNQQAMAPILE